MYTFVVHVYQIIYSWIILLYWAKGTLGNAMAHNVNPYSIFLPSLLTRFDIYGLDKSAQQDEEGIKSAARKGLSINFTPYYKIRNVISISKVEFVCYTIK